MANDLRLTTRISQRARRRLFPRHIFGSFGLIAVFFATFNV
jgi:hypothetical protein